MVGIVFFIRSYSGAQAQEHAGSAAGGFLTSIARHGKSVNVSELGQFCKDDNFHRRSGWEGVLSQAACP